MPAQMLEPEGLTYDDAAAVIGISRRHLQTLLARGEGPPVVRLGRRRIIRRGSLLRWLDEREVAR